MSDIQLPYADDVEEQHRHSIRHKYSAIAHPKYGDPFELDVEDCNISFDSSWSPYIQGDITAKLIEDQGMLDSLDPRNGCRVHIYMGYVYDGFVDDVHLVADLHIRSRTVERPSNMIKITLSSDEALAQDYKRMSWDGQPPVTGINEFVSYLAEIAQRPTPPVIASDYGASYGASMLSGITMETGQDAISLINDAAERLELWIYCDGDRTWRIKKRPDYVGATALKLTTGASSTIIEASSTLTRGEGQGLGFHNAVGIKYQWKNGSGVDQVIYGNAEVISGTYAVSSIGFNTYFEERSIPVTQSQATAAATARLKRLVGRGHQMEMTAHAAYWLRPGMTVTVQLPIGDQQRLLVRSVTFNPVSGTMNVALTQPINVTISTTGA